VKFDLTHTKNSSRQGASETEKEYRQGEEGRVWERRKKERERGREMGGSETEEG